VSIMKTHLMIAIAVVGAAGAAHADEHAPRRLTFEDAIRLATAQSPDVALAADTAAGAADKLDDARNRRLPTAKVDAAAQRWDRAPGIAGFPGFTLHDLYTTNVDVTIAQPLSGLFYLSDLVGAAEHGASAAHADLDRARLDAAYKAADAYVRAAEATATAAVAHQSVAQIDSELAQARKLREADTYNDIDVLRFQSAKAAADQAAVRADAARDQAIAGLVVALGLHDGDAIEIVDDLPAEAPPLAMSIAQAQDKALVARPELHAARERIAAAHDGERAARLGYYPDIRAMAQYQHVTGSAFQPKDQGFIGVSATWTLWDWGGTHAAVVQAAHSEKSAQISADALVDQVRLDVRKRWLDAKAGFDNLAAADTQLKTAEEAYRLQKVRFEASASTATDVLDAETDVARARLAAGNARYDYFLALVALARAVGDLPGTPR
jgi:outer membrane protein